MAVSASGKVSLPVAQAADRLLSGGSFASGSPAGTTITYSFRATAPTTMPDDTSGFSTFNAAQIRGAELALQAWADVANVRFQRIGAGDGEGAYSDQGVLRFSNYAEGAKGSAAFTYLPGPNGARTASSIQGDGWYNASLSYNANPVFYGYGQKVLVHEIGHALGLGHPGDYDGGDADISYAASAEFFEDSRQYTVMSYFSETNTGGAFAGRYACSPLLLDIAAIQKLYGANMSAFLGDTTYGFNSNAGRTWLQATDARSPLIFCVWDAGGTDTFDFSGYAQVQLIDLNPAAFSSVGGMTANVSIAAGATIEDAVGGSGADTVIGNGAGNAIRGMSGDDSVFGGAGGDDLNGNQGSDTVDGGDGADTVRGGQGGDLVIGGAGDDRHVNGNLGDDTVYGGDGNDTVFGGQGADHLFGGDGNDLMSGDLGDDALSGGAGGDWFRLAVGGGHDWVADFSAAAGDRIVLTPGTAYSLASVGGQPVIVLSGGESIGLAGVAAAQFASDWLVFA